MTTHESLSKILLHVHASYSSNIRQQMQLITGVNRVNVDDINDSFYHQEAWLPNFSVTIQPQVGCMGLPWKTLNSASNAPCPCLRKVSRLGLTQNRASGPPSQRRCAALLDTGFFAGNQGGFLQMLSNRGGAGYHRIERPKIACFMPV
jgi:hypothetical protein